VKNGLRIRGIPTSVRSRELAESLGIPLTTLDECQEIDVTVDGADEVDPELRLIKGGGGALLREKSCGFGDEAFGNCGRCHQASAETGKVSAAGGSDRFAQALVAKKIAALGADVASGCRPMGHPM